MVGGPSWVSGSSLGTLPEVWNWTGDPPGGPEVIGSHSRRSGSGREIQKWSGDPCGGTEVVGRPSQRCRNGRETVLEVRKWLRDPPMVRKWS